MISNLGTGPRLKTEESKQFNAVVKLFKEYMLRQPADKFVALMVRFDEFINAQYNPDENPETAPWPLSNLFNDLFREYSDIGSHIAQVLALPAEESVAARRNLAHLYWAHFKLNVKDLNISKELLEYAFAGTPIDSQVLYDEAQRIGLLGRNSFPGSEIPLFLHDRISNMITYYHRRQFDKVNPPPSLFPSALDLIYGGVSPNC